MKNAPAVMVKTGNLTYVQALQKIRSEPTLTDLSKDIVSVRKTGAGHLLVEMGMGTTNVEMVNTAIKKAVGGTETVSTLRQSVRIGVFGLDEITTTEEVAQGFTIASGTETEVEVVLREMSRGQQMAIITTSAEAANKVVKLRRVRVGHVERACGTKISDTTDVYQTHMKPEIATGPIALAAAWVTENQDT